MMLEMSTESGCLLCYVLHLLTLVLYLLVIRNMIHLFISKANNFCTGVSRLCAPKGPISGAVQESDVTPELPGHHIRYGHCQCCLCCVLDFPKD